MPLRGASHVLAQLRHRFVEGHDPTVTLLLRRRVAVKERRVRRATHAQLDPKQSVAGCRLGGAGGHTGHAVQRQHYRAPYSLLDVGRARVHQRLLEPAKHIPAQMKINIALFGQIHPAVEGSGVGNMRHTPCTCDSISNICSRSW
jgi:hypothetical protein